MEFEYFIIPLLILAGFMSGFINTLAGNGSVFTLSLLLFLDIPVHLANGTNRVGALTQSVTSVLSFRKDNRFQALIKEGWWYTIPTVIGAILGAWASNYVEAAYFKWIIVALMIFILFLVLAKPKRWLKEVQEEVERKTVANVLMLLGIAFYAGFIQMGMGVLYLSTFVLAFRYTLLQSNMIKIMLTVFMIVPALAIFIYQDLVRWDYGISLAFGQSIGAYIATKFALESKTASTYVRYILIAMISISIVKLSFF
ncbi:MAG: sulfite exporter TauE/SafE family protein [Flavobacteriales bacterium]